MTRILRLPMGLQVFIAVLVTASGIAAVTVGAPLAVGAKKMGEGLAMAPSAESAAKKGPRVICVEDWGPNPTGSYRHKPKHCTLHRRGSFPVGGYNTSSIKRMKWRGWGGNRATGRGKIGISTVGLVNVKVKLLRLRTRCGVTVYTKAKIKYKGEAYNGIPVKGKYKVPLDICLV